MYVCMYVCMHACMYVCMYVCMSVYRCIGMSVSYVQLTLYECMYVSMHRASIYYIRGRSNDELTLIQTTRMTMTTICSERTHRGIGLHAYEHLG
jgi:hypothetical protein